MNKETFLQEFGSLLSRPLFAMHPEHLKGFVAGVVRPFLAGTLEPEAKLSPAKSRSLAGKAGQVAVIAVEGMLNRNLDFPPYYSSYERIKRQVIAAANDPEVKAIVLRIHSPGGSVYGCEECAEVIFQARQKKPVIASVDSLAASAAYWIASAADEIAVSPSGEVGSVGVLMLHLDYSAFLEQVGIKATFVFAGDHKVDGNPFEPLNEEVKAALQADTDLYYRDFLGALNRNRAGSKAAAEKFGNGRTEVAKSAVKSGMADLVETFAETMARLGVSLYGGDRQANGRSASEGSLIYELEHDLIVND